MKEMISLWSKNTVTAASAATIKEKSSPKVITDDTHWSNIYDKHINHMKFLKENDLFTGKRKLEVLENIDNTYAEISKYSSLANKYNNDNPSDNNTNTNVS